MARRPIKRKRKSVDPDLRSPAGLSPDLVEIADRYKYPAFEDRVTGRIVTIKPDSTPDIETNTKSPYKFFFEQADGYLNAFDVRKLKNWDTERDGRRDIETRIREAVDRGILDLSK
jgi:hypothetical protein